MDIDSRILGVFRSVFGDESLEVKPEFTADDIEKWDSLNHINLIFAIEAEFGIVFSGKELEEMQNVGDLQRLVATKS